MPDTVLLWTLSAAITALSIVLWWLGRQMMVKQDGLVAKLGELESSVTKSISNLQVSVALDMGGIRERLARLEGHAGIGK